MPPTLSRAYSLYAQMRLADAGCDPVVTLSEGPTSHVAKMAVARHVYNIRHEIKSRIAMLLHLQ